MNKLCFLIQSTVDQKYLKKKKKTSVCIGRAETFVCGSLPRQYCIKTYTDNYLQSTSIVFGITKHLEAIYSMQEDVCRPWATTVMGLEGEVY